MPYRHFTHLFVIAATLLFNTACATKTMHPTQIYTLKNTQPPTTETHPKPHSKVLQIAMPQTTRELHTREIRYAVHANQRQSYAYNRWSDTPDRLIAAYLREAVANHGLFRAVTGPYSEAKADRRLESYLDDFYLQFPEKAPAYAILDMRFVLLDTANRHVIASRRFYQRVAVAKPTPQAGVDALHEALRRLASELLIWLEKLP